MSKNPNRVKAGAKAGKKGSKWENDVAHILSDWSGETFKRMPRSGSLRWGGIYWTYGDLIPPEDVRLVVECKHHADVRLLDVLGTRLTDPGGGVMSSWWYASACADSLRATQELQQPTVPFLVWKKNYCRSRLSLDMQFFNLLGVFGFTTVTTSVPPLPPFVTVDFATFLEKISLPEVIARIDAAPPVQTLA
jgi:hypothetical protein